MKCPVCAIEFPTGTTLMGHLREMTSNWRTYEKRVTPTQVELDELDRFLELRASGYVPESEQNITVTVIGNGSEHDYLLVLDHLGLGGGLAFRGPAELDDITNQRQAQLYEAA